MMDSVLFAEIVLFFGRFHVVMVHLPLGILPLAAALELFSRVERLRYVRRAAGPVLVVGTVSAVLSVVAGFMLSMGGGYDAELLSRHKWWGIGAAGISVIACALKLAPRRGTAVWLRRGYAASLIATVVGLLAVGHFGGSLSRGPDYLTYYIPTGIKAALGMSEESEVPIIENIDEAVIYTDLVLPIMERRCTSCHDRDRTEGELRLDTYEHMARGGENGAVLVPGDPEASDLHRRITLPRGHDDRMPPGARRPLGDPEMRIIRWWIEQGASQDARVADATLTTGVDEILALYSGDGSTKPWRLPEHDVPAPNPVDLERLNQIGIAILPISEEASYLQARVTATSVPLSTEAWQALRAISEQLAWVNLSHTAADDAALERLAGFGNLTRIHLNGTDITDAGLAHLSGLEHLEYLNLYDTRVTDSGLEHLVDLPNLKELYLWQTDVTDGGVASLLDRRASLVANTGFQGFDEAAQANALVAPEIYEVTGRLVEVVDDGEAAVIEHDGIPGVMEAQETTFQVPDPEELEQIPPGSRVRFRYIVEDTTGAWIEDLELLTESSSRG